MNWKCSQVKHTALKLYIFLVLFLGQSKEIESCGTEEKDNRWVSSSEAVYRHPGLCNRQKIQQSGGRITSNKETDKVITIKAVEEA